MSEERFEIEEDDSTVTFTDAGDELPVDPDPIKTLTLTILKLRHERDEARVDAEELRKAYEDSIRQNRTLLEEKLASERRAAEELRTAEQGREFAIANGFKKMEERDRYAASLQRQLNDLTAEVAVKNNAIDHLTVALDTANRKLAQFAGLHDLLERLTISADDRARKNAMEIVVAQVKHLDWNTEDLKLQASLQLGLSEAYDRTNSAICDILAGATSWEEDNWS